MDRPTERGSKTQALVTARHIRAARDQGQAFEDSWPSGMVDKIGASCWEMLDGLM